MRLACLLVPLVLLAAAPAASHADQRVPARVKALTKKGQAAYRAADFEAALDAFSKALALQNKPGLILSMAQCYRQLEQRKKALFYYKLYLTEWTRQHPDSSPAYEEEVRGHIEKLERETAEAPPATPPPAPAPAPAPAPEPARVEVSARPAPAAPAAAVAEDRPRPRRARTAGWVLLGVGTASLVTGVVFGALVRSTSDDYLSGGRTYPEAEQLKDRGKSYEKAEVATLIAGGALAATGGVLLVWDLLAARRATREATVRIVPFAAGGAAGLVGTTRF